MSKPIEKEQRVIKRHAHTLSALHVTLFNALSTFLYGSSLYLVRVRFIASLLDYPHALVATFDAIIFPIFLRSGVGGGGEEEIDLDFNFSKVTTYLLLCPLSKLGSLLSFILLFAFTQGAAINDKVCLIHFFL